MEQEIGLLFVFFHPDSESFPPRKHYETDTVNAMREALERFVCHSRRLKNSAEEGSVVQPCGGLEPAEKSCAVNYDQNLPIATRCLYGAHRSVRVPRRPKINSTDGRKRARLKTSGVVAQTSRSSYLSWPLRPPMVATPCNSAATAVRLYGSSQVAGLHPSLRTSRLSLRYSTVADKKRKNLVTTLHVFETLTVCLVHKNSPNCNERGPLSTNRLYLLLTQSPSSSGSSNRDLL